MTVKTLLNHIKRVADQTVPFPCAIAAFFKCTFSQAINLEVKDKVKIEIERRAGG